MRNLKKNQEVTLESNCSRSLNEEKTLLFLHSLSLLVFGMEGCRSRGRNDERRSPSLGISRSAATLHRRGRSPSGRHQSDEKGHQNGR